MVFSSIPAYLDPANWQQQQNHHHHHHQTGSSSANTHDLLPPPPPPPPAQQQQPPPPHPHVGGGPGSIRPGSMADRARMANLPLPETALKCPRCESTNTKFCYFNNYSLTQPRHFCKTCRRYWTRGGALRNVPVGGGCRRNKRSKGSGSSSKSPVSSGDRQTGSGTSTSATPSHNSTSTTADILGLGPQIPPLRFMAPLHHLTDHFSEIGLNYSGNIASQMAATGDINYLIGSSSSGSAGGGGAFLSSAAAMEPWRLPPPGHQFPFFAGLDPATAASLYPIEGGLDPSRAGPKGSSFCEVSQAAPVKMEENQELNLLSRQFLGINNPGNDQYWSGSTTAWTDLSGFGSSSSTSHHL